MVNFEYKNQNARYDVQDFSRIIAILRGEGGCPWDREQTHESLRRNLLEEAYEVCEAIDEGSVPNLWEELGDLLMQVIFHAAIEEENGNFDLTDVCDGACRKLIYRHPHVFSDVKVSGTGEVLENWEALKRKEKSQTTVTSALDGVARSLPGLWRAEKIQNKAKKCGFDWPSVDGAMGKLREEVDELQAGLDARDGENIAEELGDVLFSAVNVARFAGVDPEAALHQACEKFIRRFRFMEEAVSAAGRDLEHMSLEEMEHYYQQARQELEGKEPQVTQRGAVCSPPVPEY